MKALWNHPLIVVLTYPLVLAYCILLTPYAWLWDLYNERKK